MAGGRNAWVVRSSAGSIGPAATARDTSADVVDAPGPRSAGWPGVRRPVGMRGRYEPGVIWAFACRYLVRAGRGGGARCRISSGSTSAVSRAGTVARLATRKAAGGARSPRWPRNGRNLVYRADDRRLMMVRHGAELRTIGWRCLTINERADREPHPVGASVAFDLAGPLGDQNGRTQISQISQIPRISRTSQLFRRRKSEKSEKSVFAVLCVASIASAELDPFPGGHEPSGVPGVSPKETNRARRDVVSLPSVQSAPRAQRASAVICVRSSRTVGGR
jgi:hypothetical protein